MNSERISNSLVEKFEDINFLKRLHRLLNGYFENDMYKKMSFIEYILYIDLTQKFPDDKE